MKKVLISLIIIFTIFFVGKINVKAADKSMMETDLEKQIIVIRAVSSFNTGFIKVSLTCSGPNQITLDLYDDSSNPRAMHITELDISNWTRGKYSCVLKETSPNMKTKNLKKETLYIKDAEAYENACFKYWYNKNSCLNAGCDWNGVALFKRNCVPFGYNASSNNNAVNNNTSTLNVTNNSQKNVCDSFNTRVGGYLPDSGNLAGIALKQCEEAGCKIVTTNSGNICKASNVSNNGNGSGSSNINGEDGNGFIASEATCNGILAGIKDDLQAILNAMRIIAPILVGIFSVIEYLNAMLNKDADMLKKSNSRLIKRIILMLILFILPTIINLVLGYVVDSEYNTCIR